MSIVVPLSAVRHNYEVPLILDFAFDTTLTVSRSGRQLAEQTRAPFVTMSMQTWTEPEDPARAQLDALRPGGLASIAFPYFNTVTARTLQLEHNRLTDTVISSQLQLQSTGFAARVSQSLLSAPAGVLQLPANLRHDWVAGMKVVDAFNADVLELSAKVISDNRFTDEVVSLKLAAPDALSTETLVQFLFAIAGRFRPFTVDLPGLSGLYRSNSDTYSINFLTDSIATANLDIIKVI